MDNEQTHMGSRTRYDERDDCEERNLSDAGESRGAVALTVAWMLACLSTTAAMLVVLTLRLLMAILPVVRVGRHPLNNVADVLLSVAVMTGVCCLICTPLAYRVRQ